MSLSPIQDIEDKLDQLIRLCAQLEKENTSLTAKEATWELERKRLTEKNEIARTRVEAMISHLKNLETES